VRKGVAKAPATGKSDTSSDAVPLGSPIGTHRYFQNNELRGDQASTNSYQAQIQMEIHFTKAGPCDRSRSLDLKIFETKRMGTQNAFRI